MNTVDHYVYAKITNFGSIFAPFGDADITKPVINFTDPTPANASTIIVDSITINATVTDTQSNIDTCILNFDGVNGTSPMTMIGSGSSVSCNTARGNLSTGSHTYKIYANDTAGNMNVSETRTVTYAVPIPLTPGEETNPFGGGGATVQEYAVPTLPTSGQTFNLNFGDYATYYANGEQHTVRFMGSFTGAGVFEIYSLPIRVTLAVGETQRIDTNGNGILDLEITLLMRTDNAAQINLKPLPEVITPPPVKPVIPTPVVLPTAPVQKAAAFSTTNILVMIVLAAILAGLAFSMFRKKQRVPTPVSSIESYIIRELEREHGEEHIKERLSKVGWKESTINEALEKAKKDRESL